VAHHSTKLTLKKKAENLTKLIQPTQKAARLISNVQQYKLRITYEISRSNDGRRKTNYGHTGRLCDSILRKGY